MIEGESLARLLLDHPCPADEPLVCTIKGEMTAEAFRSAAQAVADQLRDDGVRPGEAVAVRLPDGAEIAAAMFGVWLAGAVFVPVNARQPEQEVAGVLDAVRPAALLDAGGLRRLRSPASFEPDVAFVMWTSGTTGAPKPILHTHAGYREILDRVLSTIPRRDATTRPAPNLIPVSLTLSAGLYNTLFGLMAGASVVLMERFVAQDFATLVARYGIRSTVLPPAAMVMLTDDAGITGLAPLRYVRSITAPLSPLAARRFMDKFGVTVLNGYGQSEVGEVIGWTAADARAHPDKLGAAGRPHPGVDIKVVDDRGVVLGPGVPGELLVRPPRMAAGYAGGESLADRVDGEGFVRTGDYAVVDDEGFVWIEGRATDLINRGGHKVFPDQVEEVLRLVPGVEEAAVAGYRTPAWERCRWRSWWATPPMPTWRRCAGSIWWPTRCRSRSVGCPPSRAARWASCCAAS
ncbi:MAG: AMP-binding protein [Acidimicrobiaceae bacterium]|nr:AMP-binding protein [Acidimicrobiaceae bacterium]